MLKLRIGSLTLILVKVKTMKNVWIQTADSSIIEVEQDVVKLCRTIYKEMLAGCGSSKNNPICLPPRIKPVFLSLVFDFCRYHNKEKKHVYKKILGVDAKILFEVMYVADYLQMKPLIDRTCEAMIQKIESTSSPEELHHLLCCNDVLTKEEQLSRIKLFKRFIIEKMKEEEESENVQNFEVVLKARHHEDTRSIDDLLAYIDGNGDSKGGQTSKKKKNRKKREGQKNTPSTCAASLTKASILKKVIESHDQVSYQDSNVSDAANHGVKSTCSSSSMVADNLKLSDTQDESFTLEDDFDDGDFDPSLSEELDREVEDFARSINLDFTVRMQEIYTSSQERRLLPVSIKGNGSKMKGLDHDHK